jgi:hypothetical protein
MTSFKTVFATAAFIGLSIAHAAAPVKATEASSLRVKPLAAVDLTLGTKRAIGYYLAENGACNMTLLLSDIDFTEKMVVANAARITTVIGAGTSSQIDTEWGQSLVLACESGAAALKVHTVDRIAYSKLQK